MNFYIFTDLDGTLLDYNNYSFGGIDPYIPSEKFSYYQDTLNIRGNWDMELSNIIFK